MVCTSKNGDKHKQTHRQDKQVNVDVYIVVCASLVYGGENHHTSQS